MSKQDPLNGIRNKRLLDLAKTAVAQKFELGATKNRHAYLQCPSCSEHITFSKNISSSDRRAYLNVRSRLRRHGLVHQGGGGEHTAPLPAGTIAAL